MERRVTKAIFPVAGLGTRFLPATKSVPKEIMTLVDRPLIQYAIDEARARVASKSSYLSRHAAKVHLRTILTMRPSSRRHCGPKASKSCWKSLKILTWTPAQLPISGNTNRWVWGMLCGAPAA